MALRYPSYKASGISWLGEIPAHWRIDRLKWSADTPVNGVWGAESDGEDDIACIRVADFDRRSFTVTTDDLTYRSIPDSDRRRRLLKRNDLLMEKSGGGEKQLVGAVVGYDHDIPAVTSNFVAKMSCLPGMHPRFWVYVHAHLYAGRVNFPAIKQTTGIQNLDAEAYFNERVAYPPEEEQIAIADHLDHETARIDALIGKKRRLLELLEEKRLAVITHAVTKGLDPNAPMKDSGIDWLGQIPAHWEVLPLTRVVRQFVDYRGSTPTKVSEGVPLITATQIKNGKIDHSLDPVFITEEEYEERMTRGFPEKGDVLVTTEAPLGETAQIDDERVAPGQRIIMMKPDLSKVTKEYLFMHFRSDVGRTELLSRASGSTASGIRADRLRASKVLVPPLPEQDKITHHIKHVTAPLPPIISAIGRQIMVLQEYRSALITNAVTGEIDVRGAEERKEAAE